MPVYNIIKIRPGSTDYLTVVHELVHALDDQKDWYITPWGTSEEEAEALAYGTEYLLNAADTSLPILDNPALIKSCEQARRYWRGAWRNFQTVLQQEIKWGGDNKRNLKAGDIRDISAKIGLRFSCSKLKPLYEKMLADRGILYNATRYDSPSYLTTDISEMIRGTNFCSCWLTCDFDFVLDPVFK